MPWLMLLAAAFAAPPEGREIDFDEVVLGEDHGCGRRGASVFCWGNNDRGQLGDGTTRSSRFPGLVEGVDNAVALVAGDYHTCAITRQRELMCWGDNQAGQLGTGIGTASTEPARVKNLGSVLTVAAGASHTCALSTSGTLSCWGSNLYSQLGISGVRSTGTPMPVPDVPQSLGVAAGYGHTCVAPNTGGVVCWGDASKGQLGRSVSDPSEPQGAGPVDAELPPVRALAARRHHTCAMHADGVTCWGTRPDKPSEQASPEVTVAQRGLVALSLGWGHGCALAGNQQVTCFGDDAVGQLGGRLGKKVVTGAYGLKDAVAIAAGRGESCAARGRDKRTVCWGSYTKEEVLAARQEQAAPPSAPPTPKRRELHTDVRMTLAAEEILTDRGPQVRLTITTLDDTPCANTRLDITLRDQKKRLTKLDVGDPFLPKGDCINTPGPAVGIWEFPRDTHGRMDVSLRHKKKEDYYQIYFRKDKLDIIALQSTYTAWPEPRLYWRVPPGSLAISCTDHLSAPLCERRSRDGLPTCRDVLRDPLITSAPSLDAKRFASEWFSSDPGATLISPDFGHDRIQALITNTHLDGSGCLDIEVRTWKGEVWRNVPR